MRLELKCFEDQEICAETCFKTPPILKIQLAPEQQQLTELQDCFLELYDQCKQKNQKQPSAYTGDVNYNADWFQNKKLGWLNQSIQKYIKKYVEDYFLCGSDLKLMYQKAWPVVMENGHSIMAHKHNNAHLSAVFYVHCPNECKGGDILFSNECNWFPSMSPGIQTQKLFTVGIRPKTKLLLIFPSSFTHAVTKYESTEPRYSISYDIFITASKKLENKYHENISPDPRNWREF
jgi:uncharacterized protein (TIGR02466 family)